MVNGTSLHRSGQFWIVFMAYSNTTVTMSEWDRNGQFWIGFMAYLNTTVTMSEWDRNGQFWIGFMAYSNTTVTMSEWDRNGQFWSVFMAYLNTTVTMSEWIRSEQFGYFSWRTQTLLWLCQSEIEVNSLDFFHGVLKRYRDRVEVKVSRKWKRRSTVTVSDHVTTWLTWLVSR